MNSMRHLFIVLLSAICFTFNSCDSNQSEIPNDRSGQSQPDERLYSGDKSKPLLSGNEGRASWQKPELLIGMLGDLSEKTVADIGAGTGYFAWRLVFNAKKVIAVDIDEEMIQLMEMFKLNLPESVQKKFETRLAEPADPHLNPFEADVAIIINTVGYIENRTDYLRNLKKNLKHGGKLMIVDYKMKKLPIEAPPFDLRVSLNDIETTLQSAGYTNIVSDDTSLDYQYIVIARNP